MLMLQMSAEHQIGLMVIVGVICLDEDPDEVPDDAGPMTLPDGCVS